MNEKIHIKSAVVGALLGAVVVLSIAAATASGGRVTWEYRVIDGVHVPEQAGKRGLQKMEPILNDAGKDGWELVGYAWDQNFNQPTAILKRAVK
jgi:hypothetical protein